MTDWLTVHEGDGPLVVSIPHAGTWLPDDLEARIVSPWLARKDADWWIDHLYGFAECLGATMVRTSVSRTVIDVNRDPSGASLYPGMATTSLCPTTTFDSEPLYLDGQEPDEAEIAARRARWFDPYHEALTAELDRLRAKYERVVLYEAHSIRSRVPQLFDGELPNFNIGTNSGASCDARLTQAVEVACNATPFSRVTNGRFKGGWTTRHYGQPDRGMHAIQMELACRGYMAEPTETLTAANWPPAFAEATAAPMRAALTKILEACIAFARA